jgi:hypothetical protein
MTLQEKAQVVIRAREQDDLRYHALIIGIHRRTGFPMHKVEELIEILAGG